MSMSLLESGIDLPPDGFPVITPAEEILSDQGLRDADTTVGRVVVHETGEEALMVKVLLATAVAIEGIQDLRDLPGNPVGLGWCTGKVSRR
jgi:hypothetical protein